MPPSVANRRRRPSPPHSRLIPWLAPLRPLFGRCASSTSVAACGATGRSSTASFPRRLERLSWGAGSSQRAQRRAHRLLLFLLSPPPPPRSPPLSASQTARLPPSLCPVYRQAVLQTMREGERALAMIGNHRMGYGVEGEPALGIPPKTALEYEMTLVQVRGAARAPSRDSFVVVVGVAIVVTQPPPRPKHGRSSSSVSSPGARSRSAPRCCPR